MEVSEIGRYYDLDAAYALRDNLPKEIMGEELPGLAEKGATEEERWLAAKRAFYGSHVVLLSFDWGLIDFNPVQYALITNRDDMSYDDYLEVMKKSCRLVRSSFERCYYEAMFYSFKGTLESINVGKGSKDTVCFKLIRINAFRSDGTGFVGKEEHVWMNISGFEKFKVGDCLSFGADIYRYIKTGNGKCLDFGLRNPTRVKLIDEYELPSDDELLQQEIDDMICEQCLYQDHCYGNGICLANQQWKEDMRKQLLELFEQDNEQEAPPEDL